MKKRQKQLPAGISILRYFYILNTLLFGLVILLFYKHTGIMMFGFILPLIPEIIVKIALITLPFYLYFRLKSPTPKLFSLILGYHSFFLINSIFNVGFTLSNFSIMSLLQVIDKKSADLLDVSGNVGYTIKHISVDGLNIVVGFVILFYIYFNKNFFEGVNK